MVRQSVNAVDVLLWGFIITDMIFVRSRIVGSIPHVGVTVLTVSTPQMGDPALLTSMLRLLLLVLILIQRNIPSIGLVVG